MAREKLSQVEVLTWLKENHPGLHRQAEVDREWVWITGEALRPAHKKEGDTDCACQECGARALQRAEVKAYGFVFSRQGHATPSGKKAWWGHSCLKPLPFKRKGDGKQRTSEQVTEAEAMALLGL